MVNILKSFSQGLKNLSPGINQAAAGAAETSPLWAKDLINRQTLGRKREVEREEEERKNTLREAEFARDRAKYGLELAIESGDNTLLVNAVRYAQDAQLLDPLVDPAEMALNLIPDPMEDITLKPVSGDPSTFYYTDPTTRKPVIVGSDYKPPPPVLSDFIDAGQRAAENSGYKAGLEVLAANMGRPLLPEEIDRVKEAYIAVAPVLNENDGIFQYLQTLSKDARTRTFYGMTPTMQGALLNDYGVSMDLGDKPIEAFERRAKEAATPLLALELVDEYLKDPKYAEVMGPFMGRALGWNAYHKDAKTFQARMLLTTQIVGKFLEGGVLRQEDTIKYKEMLPKLTDTVVVAQNKVRMVQFLIESMRDLYSAGGTVTKTLDEQGQEVEKLVIQDLRSPEGELMNPADPSVPLADISAWMKANTTHAYYQEVKSVFQRRREIILYQEETK